jgi:two-component system, chemotaxis family, sensor kinase CheA
VTNPPDERGAELRELFFETSQELLQALNDEALKLEKKPGDEEIVRVIRRTVHTLKGDSAACGLRELSELAHQFEDALSLEGAAAQTAVAEIAFQAADVFAAMITAYHRGKKLPATASLSKRIEELTSVPVAKKSRRKKVKPAVAATTWTEYERLEMAEAQAKGLALYHAVVKIDPHCAMPIAARQLIQNAIGGVGRVVAVRPEAKSPAATKHVEFVLASAQSAEQIAAKCRIPTITEEATVDLMPSIELGGKRLAKKSARTATKDIAAVPGGSAASEGQASALVGSTVELDPTSAGTGEPAVATETLTAETGISDAAAGEARSALPAITETPIPQSTVENILRVEAGRIDSVLNLVGELIIGKSMLQQALNEFSKRFPKELLRGKFADAMAFQARVLNDLQRSVMKIRMVPVEQLFRRFPRMVRDVSRQCGREVELVLSGQETDLDKGILDAIAEPLTHLVRNAVSHGIEPAEQRRRAGKALCGVIRLNAYHQGNQVIVEVSDDGRGVDIPKIRNKVIELGLVTEEEAARLSEAEMLDFIFRPGFTTAEHVTEVSGRGVGMDVVQSVLHRLKASIGMETHAGKGTTFRMKLPLTLAIIKALLFWVEQRLYAIPLNAVVEIARTAESEVHQVDNYEVLQLRNQVLPLLRLGRPQVTDGVRGSGKLFVLVITVGEKKFGLIVDALEGEEELVIKALDDQTISTDLVSGASILGDGRVVLILNLGMVVEHFARSRPNVMGTVGSGLLLSHADRSQPTQNSAVTG